MVLSQSEFNLFTDNSEEKDHGRAVRTRVSRTHDRRLSAPADMDGHRQVQEGLGWCQNLYVPRHPLHHRGDGDAVGE